MPFVALVGFVSASRVHNEARNPFKVRVGSEWNPSLNLLSYWMLTCTLFC